MVQLVIIVSLQNRNCLPTPDATQTSWKRDNFGSRIKYRDARVQLSANPLLEYKLNKVKKILSLKLRPVEK